MRAGNLAGAFEPADVHVARRLGDLVGEQDDSAVLALAIVVRAVRRGSVCVDLGESIDPEHFLEVDGEDAADDVAAARDEVVAGWPTDAGAWTDAVRRSALAGAGVLRLEHDLVYLDRYHREERQVADGLRDRIAQAPPAVEESLLREGLQRLFPGDQSAEQRAVAHAAAGQWTTVLTGGPGTGKTTTVAGLLVLLGEQWDRSGSGRTLRVALAAPTGKAAARLQESVAEAATRLDSPDAIRIAGLEAMTLHRLLGWNPRSRNVFRHNASNRLAYDVIVVDETSMMSLSMMAHLLAATKSSTRLIFVGDADQLASVDAGAVLADLVDGFNRLAPQTVCRLSTAHRFDAEIGALAAAVRDGRADDAVAALRAGEGAIRWVQDDDPAEVLRPALVDTAVRLREAALGGDVDAALGILAEHRLLCAQRRGPRGIRFWNKQIQGWLTEATGDPLWEAMYPGRPLLVTRNDYSLGVYNGDSGVVIHTDDLATAAIETSGGVLRLAAGRLSEIETMYAMTVHKSQGSEATRVTVLLPDDESPLLTRELLYTAVTRARQHVTVVGSEQTVRRAVEGRISRATGLRARLAASPPAE
ncbi:exodeoxyribonuclease V subunit alpha [Flexivirga caeni]|uniref:RecBCD enzyme subunit RecD n=1 Tax=Flexivirga caeni TaxID=2294115 RepID=A0A3M9M5W5_9MICO|nr:exodeoxyribonuclease V subunit alpha [Flexivirga caeni]